MIGLSSITVLLFSYIIYRVIKAVKFTDPIFIAMLIFLQLTLILTIVYYSYLLKLEKKFEANDFTINRNLYCESALYTSMPALMLALGTLLNINKWTYYNFRTRAYHKRLTSETKAQLLGQTKWLNLTTLVIFCCLIAPYLILYIRACSNSTQFTAESFQLHITEKIGQTTEIIFGCLFILFSVVSVHLIFTLRTYVPALYS